MNTTLKVINEMAVSMGTRPFTSNDTQHPTYVKARTKLDAVSYSVQGRGWWFNKSKATLRQNTAGEVIVPSAALSVDPTDTTKRYVQRGNRLYDQTNRTYIIGADVLVHLVEEVAVEDLPPLAYDYVRCRAVYEFYLTEGGTNPKLQEYKDARNVAFTEFRAEHLRAADINFFSGTSSLQMVRGYRRGLPLTDTEDQV